jgi:hypothetical protein
MSPPFVEYLLTFDYTLRLLRKLVKPKFQGESNEANVQYNIGVVLDPIKARTACQFQPIERKKKMSRFDLQTVGLWFRKTRHRWQNIPLVSLTRCHLGLWD